MKFIDYLKDKIVFLAISFICLVFLLVYLYLFKANIVLKFIVTILFLIIILFDLLYDYFRKKDYYNNITKMLETLDKAYLLTEMIDEPQFIDGKLFYTYLCDINKSMNENVNKYKYNTKEFREYLELWCHEIKTPIATSKMIITNHKNETTNSIQDEINKIDNYVEQVLYYSRSNNVDKDYIIKEISLNEVVDNVIKRNKKDLINKKIKVEIDLKGNVYSDSKWLEFIINQIITNSIKYSKNAPYIKITSKQNKDNTILYIEDNGIGINKNELDKVFDKGFTGTNGRKKYNSTGIGLYLCKKLCKKLHHQIFVNSDLNVGTIVSIIFPASSAIEDITK